MSGISPSKTSISIVIEALKQCENIYELDLSQNLLEEREMLTILNAVPQFNSVNTLKLESLRMSYDTSLQLSQVLMDSHNLKRYFSHFF